MHQMLNRMYKKKTHTQSHIFQVTSIGKRTIKLQRHVNQDGSGIITHVDEHLLENHRGPVRPRSGPP